jgi:DNA-binding CsgD family transcriptional regulator
LLAEYAGLNLVLGALDGPFGSADRYLAALGSLVAAPDVEDLFASALEMDTRMRAPVHQAATLALHLEHLRRSGETGARVRLLRDQALAIAEPLGLARVLRTAVVARGEAAVAGSRPDGLTARESDVLALLAEGMSNQAIARRLRISDNTAANHVRSILAKTGSQNRTQAALYGHARG